MHAAMHTLAFALTLAPTAALLATAPAQDRVPWTGRVLDAAGAPAAGATVRLWGSALPTDTGERIEALRADTGDDGTFALALRPDFDYAGFASTEDAASGVAHCDAATRDLALRLRPSRPSALRIHGTDAWRDEGPLRFLLVVPAEVHCALPLTVVADEATLPPLPAGDLLLEVRTQRDEVLALPHVVRRREAAEATLLPPVVVPVRVVDGLGDPVPGVAVRHLAGRITAVPGRPFAPVPRLCWRNVGTSDGDGRVAARLPLPRNPLEEPGPDLSIVLTAAAPGCAEAQSGWQIDAFVDGEAADPDGELPLVLRPAEPYRVRLLQGGAPLAHRRLVLLARAMTMRQDGLQLGLSVTLRPFAAVTDADGVATVADLPLDFGEFRAVVAAAPGAAPAAARARFVRLPDQREGLPTVDLAEAGALEVRLRDAAGRPVAGCEGVLLPAWPDLLLLEPFGGEPRFRTDAEGLARIEVQCGRWWLFATDGENFAHRLLVIGDGQRAGDGDEVGQVELTTAALQRHELAVAREDVDGRGGAPCPGARFDAHGSRWIDGAPIPPPDELLDHQFLGVLDRWLADGARADEDGRLVVRFVPPVCTVTFGKVRWGSAESGELDLRAGSAARAVVVR